MKLTAQQEKAMLAMKDGASAYELRVSLATMDALKRRGFVEARSGLGSMFSPRTSIAYYLTSQGRGWQMAHKAQEAAQ